MNSKVAEVKGYELKRIIRSTKASRILLRDYSALLNWFESSQSTHYYHLS